MSPILRTRQYYSPGLRIVYADVDGNVGYHTMVHRPLTARSPRRALEGWTGREEVLGRVPFDELPHLLNPESGYISHANNLPVGSWYPYDLGLATGGTGHTSPSLRLHELLKGDRKFSVEDFESVIHRDDVNQIVATLLPIARKVAEEDQVTDAAVLGLLEGVKAQIVDLADVDNSRSMCAPGNAEDGAFRTNQVDLWVRGTTHPAPLSRAKLEALGTSAKKLTALA